ncbi:hypothetical protein KIN20_030316 [Parelaphostrongylus tenuis]|uniref:Uncharacterized protein n=1 Tax=Parelaphostrongylus tenuis TaxID=148309 RepID=A0AAD5R3K3_PARTN|nr:hypothetical protein KIN20_030316 [Parelaphostrongylus tenuis]
MIDDRIRSSIQSVRTDMLLEGEPYEEQIRNPNMNPSDPLEPPYFPSFRLYRMERSDSSVAAFRLDGISINPQEREREGEGRRQKRLRVERERGRNKRIIERDGSEKEEDRAVMNSE